MADWKVTIDIPDEWDKLSEEEMTIQEFFTVMVTKMKDLNGQRGVFFDRWINHFEKLAKDPRFKHRSTSAVSKFDSVWNSFYDWCDSHRVWINVHFKARPTV